MLNLVRALNLSVRLSSTGLVLRKVVCTSVHAATFSVFFCCCLKMDKNRLFQEGPDFKPKKKLLVNLLLFFEGIVRIVGQKNYV